MSLVPATTGRRNEAKHGLNRVDLVLQWIADGPDEQPRYVLIHISALSAKRGDRNGDCRLHDLQPIRDLAQQCGGALTGNRGGSLLHDQPSLTMAPRTLVFLSGAEPIEEERSTPLMLQ
jgi:hypothetical protein